MPLLPCTSSPQERWASTARSFGQAGDAQHVVLGDRRGDQAT